MSDKRLGKLPVSEIVLLITDGDKIVLKKQPVTGYRSEALPNIINLELPGKQIIDHRSKLSVEAQQLFFKITGKDGSGLRFNYADTTIDVFNPRMRETIRYYSVDVTNSTGSGGGGSSATGFNWRDDILKVRAETFWKQVLGGLIGDTFPLSLSGRSGCLRLQKNAPHVLRMFGRLARDETRFEKLEKELTQATADRDDADEQSKKDSERCRKAQKELESLKEQLRDRKRVLEEKHAKEIKQLKEKHENEIAEMKADLEKHRSGDALQEAEKLAKRATKERHKAEDDLAEAKEAHSKEIEKCQKEVKKLEEQAQQQHEATAKLWALTKQFSHFLREKPQEEDYFPAAKEQKELEKREKYGGSNPDPALFKCDDCGHEQERAKQSCCNSYHTGWMDCDKCGKSGNWTRLRFTKPSEEKDDDDHGDDDDGHKGKEKEEKPKRMEMKEKIAIIHEVMDPLIGHPEITEWLIKLVRKFTLDQMRRDEGLEGGGAIVLHSAFFGKPGTGKTLYARKIGEVMKRIGILKKGHLVVGERDEMIGGYIGQTAIKCKQVFKKALDGVLFIDEAYKYIPRGEKDYAHEWMDEFVPFLWDNRERVMVIVAGYDVPMRRFLDVNEGLRSRIPNHIPFADYTAEELYSIFSDYEAKNRACKLADDLIPAAKKAMELPNMNGREVNNLISRMILERDDRIGQLEDDEMLAAVKSGESNTLQLEDLRAVLKVWSPTRNETPHDYGSSEAGISDLLGMMIGMMGEQQRFQQEVMAAMMHGSRSHTRK